MRRLGFPALWKLLLLSSSVLAVGALLPGEVGSIGWEQPGEEGEWLPTPYAQAQDDNCHATAGEVCMEWVVDGQGSGWLCCATGGTCQLHNFRFEGS